MNNPELYSPYPWAVEGFAEAGKETMGRYGQPLPCTVSDLRVVLEWEAPQQSRAD
jgi:hypothetical protein